MSTSTVVIDSLSSLSPLSKAALTIASFIVVAVARKLLFTSTTTSLSGPPSESWVSGTAIQIINGTRHGHTKEWYQQYGSVFSVPWLLGTKQIILCDPKAVAHFYAKDSIIYGGTKSTKKFIEIMVCAYCTFSSGNTLIRAL
jgi:hypothetical protein